MNYIDLHCDTLWALSGQEHLGDLSHNQICVDVEKLKASNNLLQCFACYEDMGQCKGDSWEAKADEAYKQVCKLLDFYKEQNQGKLFRTCLNQEDLLFKKPGLYSILTVEEGGILNGQLERLDNLYSQGVRLMTLMWNYENCLGFPNSTDINIMSQGLKPFGRQVVEKMNQLHMVVDVSHMSDGGFYQVAELMRKARKPFVASHSCARALCNHQRNMTDDMLKILGNGGGVVGVNFFGMFLNQKGISTVESIVEHVMYMISKAGIESVAIGSDFDGFEGGSELKDASYMPALFQQLKKAGLKESQIEKVAFLNSQRVLREIL